MNGSDYLRTVRMIGSGLTEAPVSLFRVVGLWTVLLGALLTASDDFSWSLAPGRFVYWTAHIGLGLIVVSLATQWLQRIWLSRLNDGFQLAISTVVAVIVFAPVGIVLDLLIPDSLAPQGHADFRSSVHNEGFAQAVLEEMGAYAPTVIVVWLIVHLSYRFMHLAARQVAEDSRPKSGIDEEIGSNTESAGIFEKLPQALGTDIVFIRSDANYVHVNTTKGKTMFLYSLAKASEELGDRGVLVHKSYWICFDHVQAVKRQGSQMTCLMTDTTSVPVSRRRQKSLVGFFGKDFVRVKSKVQGSGGEDLPQANFQQAHTRL